MFKRKEHQNFNSYKELNFAVKFKTEYRPSVPNLKNILMSKWHLRTFAPIVSAHPYCARLHLQIHMHVMHRAHEPSAKMNNDRADGHCYSFAWI